MSAAYPCMEPANLQAWADRHGGSDTRFVEPRRSLWLDRLHAHRSRELRPDRSVSLQAIEGWTAPDAARLEKVVHYACNICGIANRAPLKMLDRERATCRRCGSSVRLRSMIDLLSRALFGVSLAIPDFPRAPGKSGIGTSDSSVYAGRLARKLDYVNTFYHQAPRLDICAPDPDLHGSCDFVISTDVLEHVVAPVHKAFDGVYSLLRPGGALIGSVPFSLKDAPTAEHFPELHQPLIFNYGGKRQMHNRRRDGTGEIFDQLRFHGGDGATLEMRLFTRAGLTSELERAGFSRIHYCGQDVLAWGITWLQPWSIPFIAFK